MNFRPGVHVVTAVQERWSERGREWALAVPDELAQLCSRFNAVPVRTLPARYSFVVAACTPSGSIVLRTSPDPAGRFQAEVSCALANVGAGPAIHGIVTTATGTWIAMEQIDPGISLDQAGLSDDSTRGVVNVLSALKGQPSPLSNMQRIDQWLRERLSDDRLMDVAPGQIEAPLIERQKALRILDRLTEPSYRQDLCHGDLHPGNALVRADGRLFLIDPRGVSGEVAYDVAVFALKAACGTPAPAQATAGRLAMRIGADPRRAQAWVKIASAARV